MADALLEEGLKKLGLGGNEDRISSLLARYIEEIELFNPAYGLVKVRDHEELIVKHILDSLAPLGVIRDLMEPPAGPKRKLIADIGSGAGLPGMPLAVCMPNAVFTLVERMGRRAGFLRDAAAVLGLSNVMVEEAEMEKLARSRAGSFDLIVFRAFRPLEPVILKGLFALLASGGILAAYKGRRQSIEEEIARLERFPLGNSPRGNLRWEIIPLEVPFLEEERHLVLIRCL